ncbi:MAG: DNA mismatch repair endonuclease MutL [Prevotella sp.]|nr:DNA mismatch repair endonuclease MutL [Prevotella sp.]
MPDIIHLLPDSVANQIAAGEVIQRPASVIKELVENAIDAGAHNIRVLVVDAGRTTIQVIDDGCGMSETDARLAFERHATSKIRQADDLFALHTMGFRGEALPSIAAVAQVELTTRMASDDIGTRLTIQGSHVIGQEPTSCPVGSNFKVENLFFNVPARRKFLKTNATELNNILTAFERIVLVYPDIAFSMYSNGQELLNLRAGSLRQRIADVFGKRLNQDLLPVEVDTMLCRITGFVGKPESARRKGAHNYFFVNGRYMKHAYFHKAVIGAFERLVPTGMLIPYFIYFDVAPANIDVNIHPTKMEIKFENEQDIFQILAAAVKDAIGRFCDVPTIDFDTEGRPDIPVFDPTRNAVQMPHVAYNPAYNPFDNTKEKASLSDRTSREGCDTVVAPPIDPPIDPSLDLGTTSPAVVTSSPSLSPASPADRSPVHYQYKARYVMTAVKSGLMIIDQHRADIRIRYEHYLAAARQHTAATQQVLFPDVLQFPPSETVVMQQLLPQLLAVGFDISPLGGGSYAVNGIPAGLDGTDPQILIRNMVADAAERTATPDGDLYAPLALSMARHAAITYGQVLTNEEMERLVNELFLCSDVNHTPDGHLILSILPQQDFDRLFSG